MSKLPLIQSNNNISKSSLSSSISRDGRQDYRDLQKEKAANEQLRAQVVETEKNNQNQLALLSHSLKVEHQQQRLASAILFLDEKNKTAPKKNIHGIEKASSLFNSPESTLRYQYKSKVSGILLEPMELEPEIVLVNLEGIFIC